MTINLSLLVTWLICSVLANSGALAAREEEDSRKNIHPVSSLVQAPLPPPAAPDLCKSRVETYGYKCEEHLVTTKDGYILGIHRIPEGRLNANTGEKTPVLLVHGLLMDAMTWLLLPPNGSLGFILADHGYDVWMGNIRGTLSSRKHTFLSTNDSAYWDWSWDEHAAFDLPAMLKYVYSHTAQQKMHYVGHSLGSLIAFASLSEHKLLNMVRSASMLCPIAYLKHISSPLAQATANAFVAEAYYWLGMDEFVSTGRSVIDLFKRLCELPGIDCSDLLTAFTGKNCCINVSTIHVFAKYEPQSTSTKTMIHLAQMIRRDTISKYDYNDYNENMKHYGQPTPPAYNMSTIPRDIPFFFGHGGEDRLSDVADIRHLLCHFKPHKLQIHRQPNYAHTDYIMGYNAKEVIYDHIIQFMKTN